MENSIKTAKSTVKRSPSRGVYDRTTVNSLLDQAFMCHTSYVIKDKPFMIPTCYGRKEDTIYLHGSVKSQMMVGLGKQLDLCFCVTFLDGLVLARSAFHHSVNYRSVILYGKAEFITDEAEKNEALRIITDQIIPHRWDEVRAPNAGELKATAVLKFKIEEGGAKIRTGDPSDDKEDYELPIWAGVVPIQQVATAPIPDPLMTATLETPKSVTQYLQQNPLPNHEDTTS